MNSKGKTVCKEVVSDCKCTVVEKPMKKKGETNKKKDFCGTDNLNKDKNECVATIVGVLSLPDNFCRKEKDSKSDREDEDHDPCKDDHQKMKKDKCAEVYRDLGECLQKCITKTSKGSDRKTKC